MIAHNMSISPAEEILLLLIPRSCSPPISFSFCLIGNRSMAIMLHAVLEEGSGDKQNTVLISNEIMMKGMKVSRMREN